MDPHSIARSSLFAGLPPEQVKALLEVSRPRRFKRGEVVFHQGDVGSSLHVIVRGRFAVRVYTPQGDQATLVVLPQGEVFGEMAVIGDRELRSATVVALEPGETMSIDRRDFEVLRRSRPGVSEVLLTILAHKVRRYTGQLLEALYVPADIRVLRRLAELAEVYGGGQESPTIRLTQEDMAGIAGTSRATVNRVLHQEQQRGTLKVRRGNVTICDLPRLRCRAGI